MTNDSQESLLAFEYEDREFLFWLPDHTTDFVQCIMWKNKSFWERKMLERVRRWLPERPVVVDVGGFVGNHAIYFARVCEAREVVTFEPQPRMANVLEYNAALNGVDQIVRLLRVALGERVGRASVLGRLVGSAATTAFCYDDQGSVPVETIDGFEFQWMDLLKVDVEGMELSVLRGASSALSRLAPLVWVEAASGRSYHDVENYLNEQGYKLLEPLSEMDYLFRK